MASDRVLKKNSENEPTNQIAWPISAGSWYSAWASSGAIHANPATAIRSAVGRARAGLVGIKPLAEQYGIPTAPRRAKVDPAPEPAESALDGRQDVLGQKGVAIGLGVVL